jgi:uncharacterized protein with PQ loop repeat
LAPWKTIQEIEKTGDTKGMTPLPFFFMVGANVLWSLYGLLVPDTVVFIVNAGAIPILCRYFLVVFSNSKEKRVTEIVAYGFTYVILLCYAVTVLMLQMPIDVQVTGILGDVMVCLLYAAPLLNMYTAWKNKSLDPIPLRMGLAALINSSLWCVYGLGSGQMLVALPNFVGIICGSLQTVEWFMLRKMVTQLKGVPLSDSMGDMSQSQEMSPSNSLGSNLGNQELSGDDTV